MEQILPSESHSKKVGYWPVIGLFIFMIALSIYGEVESQWFNSYVKNVSGKGNFEVSLMVSMSGIIGSITFIFWGIFSDNSKSRYGMRKPILVIGSVSTALFVILFGITTEYWWLLICDGIIIAITSNMFHVGNRALIPDIWPPEQRGRISTIMFIGSSLGSVFIWVFSLLALPGNAQAYTRETHQAVFNFAGIGLIIASIVIWFTIKESKSAVEPQKFSVSLSRLFNRKELMKHPDFLKMFLASIFTIMATNAFKPFILIMLQELTFTPDFIIQVAILLIGSVVAVVFLMLRRLDRDGRKPVTMIGLTIAPIGGLILGFSNYNSLLITIGLVILFPFMLGLDIAIQTWTADLLPEGERGKFLGIVNIMRAAGQAPGVLIAGFFADQFGTVAVFIVTACFLLIAIPFFQKIPETLKKTK